jgi:preprotein translocase subunit YajC
MTCQYHIADASGDAVVISGGADGKVAYTRIDPDTNYLLSTNFNLAQPEKGPVDFRWHTATERLDALGNGEILSPEYAMDLMEAVHLEQLTTFTLYQNVLNLNENKIYLSYMSQYNEIAEIDMEEEFKKGKRVVEMRELFSPETAEAGDAAYQRFADRFTAAKIGVIALVVLLIVGMIYLISKTIRRGRSSSDL